VLPEPFDAPVAFVLDAIQVYVVPATELGFVISMEVDSPVQIT
jgi:hypothetical protein